jgi:hypothetical protein
VCKEENLPFRAQDFCDSPRQTRKGLGTTNKAHMPTTAAPGDPCARNKSKLWQHAPSRQVKSSLYRYENGQPLAVQAGGSVTGQLSRGYHVVPLQRLSATENRPFTSGQRLVSEELEGTAGCRHNSNYETRNKLLARARNLPSGQVQGLQASYSGESSDRPTYDLSIRTRAIRIDSAVRLNSASLTNSIDNYWAPSHMPSTALLPAIPIFLADMALNLF